MRKKRFLIFFVTVVHISYCFGQEEKKIDSLKNLLNNSKDDTSKVNTLNALSRIYSINGDYDQSNKYAKEAILLGEKLDFKKGLYFSYTNLGINNWIEENNEEALNYQKTALKYSQEAMFKTGTAIAYNNIGLVYANMGDPDEAIKNYLTSANLCEQNADKKNLANAYYNIGNTYYSPLSNFPEAIKAHIKSLELSKEIKDTVRVTARYIDIGNSYESLGNYQEAIKNYLAALKLAEITGQKGNVASSYNNIGEIYKNQENYDEALKNYQAGLSIAQEINSKYLTSVSFDNIGEIYEKQGRYTEAMKNHLAALEMGKEMNYTYGIAYSYLNIGNTFFLQSGFNDALKNYQNSFNLFKQIEENEGMAKAGKNIGEAYFKLRKFTESRNHLKNALAAAQLIHSKKIIKECYEILSGLDSATGQWEQAFHDQKQLALYKDSLINEQNTRNITKSLLGYEFEKKQDSLQYQQALTSEQLKKQKQAKNYFIIGLILFGILSIFIYRNYRTRQQLKLQTLRNKIASDLHDEVGSTLTSISIFSQMARQESKETIPLLETIGESSRKMLDAMADIVWTINPENDQFEEIILRMRNFAYELLGVGNIEFRFLADSNIADINLSMEARRNIYLIFKEATSNMVKYSGADKALFSIKGENDKLIMLIKDNGKGFDNNGETNGNGLKNMKKRANDMGAVLLIDSTPENGTTIKLELAL